MGWVSHLCLHHLQELQLAGHRARRIRHRLLAAHQAHLRIETTDIGYKRDESKSCTGQKILPVIERKSQETNHCESSHKLEEHVLTTAHCVYQVPHLASHSP